MNYPNNGLESKMVLCRMGNDWFHRYILPSVIARIQGATPNMNFLKTGIDTKYINIRIDNRTGDFILLDGTGKMLDNNSIKTLYNIDIISGD